MTKDNPLNLPWYSEYEPDTALAGEHHIYDSEGDYRGLADEANAAYIVRCCNMFPELIAVLERLAGDDTEAKLLLERAKQ